MLIQKYLITFFFSIYLLVGSLLGQGLLLPPVNEPEAREGESLSSVLFLIRDAFEAVGCRVYDRSLVAYLPLGGWDQAHRTYRSVNFGRDLAKGLKLTFPETALLTINAKSTNQNALQIDVFFLKDLKTLSLFIPRSNIKNQFEVAKQIVMWSSTELKKANFNFTKISNQLEPSARMTSLFPLTVSSPTLQGYFQTCEYELQGRTDLALKAIQASLSNEPNFYFSKLHFAYLWMDETIRRDRMGFNVPTNLDGLMFAQIFPTYLQSPEHPRLNRVLGYLSINLGLYEFSTNLFHHENFIQNKDSEFDKLSIRFYQTFSNRFTNQEEVDKKIYDAYRHIIKLENSSESYVEYSRVLLADASKQMKQGKTKTATALYSAIKKNLDRALIIDPNNAWVNDLFALFYMDPNNHAYYRNAVALGSALTAIQKSGGQVPAILFTTAKAYYANSQISMTYVSMEKLLAMSKRKEYVDAFEKIKNP